MVKKIDTPPVQLQLFYPVNGYLVESNNTSSLNIYLKAIQNNQVKSIVISGFADPTGNIDYNQKLSKKRADSVAKWLINHGVASSKINIIGAGIDSEKEDFQQARRVDIVIYVK
jgi:OOP family OmpA-OmpF porin